MDAVLRESNAIATIAYRDLLKLMRDPARWAFSFIFPLIFIGVLGGSLQANLGGSTGIDFVAFTFTGVLAQTMFQSAASGVISLIEDRENDFSQEIFVSPISRYSIVGGKIVGESLVALVQAVPILLLGLVLGLPLTPVRLIGVVAGLVLVCLLGGSFGVMVLSNLSNQRTAQQIFPFLIFPQYFLAGIFNPIQVLPLPLEILSRISPLRYAVDFIRGIFYVGIEEYPKVVLEGALFNLGVMAAMFAAFLLVGTFFFVRGERNR
jgi:ABC-2 type transport system permease protein